MIKGGEMEENPTNLASAAHDHDHENHNENDTLAIHTCPLLDRVCSCLSWLSELIKPDPDCQTKPTCFEISKR